jgi:hypothetical protein
MGGGRRSRATYPDPNSQGTTHCQGDEQNPAHETRNDAARPELRKTAGSRGMQTVHFRSPDQLREWLVPVGLLGG